MTSDRMQASAVDPETLVVWECDICGRISEDHDRAMSCHGAIERVNPSRLLPADDWDMWPMGRRD